MAKPRRERTIPRLDVATRKRRKPRNPVTPPFVDYSPGPKPGTKRYECPASTTKKKCIAQLMFVRGKRNPVIRFCDKKGKAGTEIEVKTVTEALRVTSQMCDCMTSGKPTSACKTKIKR